jgi:hypothetical protein
MKILSFGLSVMIYLMISITILSDSFGEQSEEFYAKMLDDDIKNKGSKVLIPEKYVTKNILENSYEFDYSYARAWNNTMYEQFQDEQKLPHEWWTGVTLYRIGEIDPRTGTYELDFNYWIQIFDERDFTNFLDNAVNDNIQKSFSVDFVNALDIESEETKGIVHKPHYYDAMINGVFYTEMDFAKFPFETINLEIIVEPGHNLAYPDVLNNTVQFQRWPYPALFSEGVPSPEYEIQDYSISIEDHQYSEGDTFSRYVIEFEVQRNVYGAFLKYIFPIIVMASLAGAALIFPSQEYMTKIELNAIFLLGILFFVQVVVEEIPATGEMTIFDAVVILGYLVIMVTMGIPALKWWKRVKFERMDEDYEEWKFQDRRSHDLYQEKLQRIQSRMLFLAEKIQLKQGVEDTNNLKEELELLEKVRIHVISLKNVEEDMRSVVMSKRKVSVKETLLKKLDKERKRQANFVADIQNKIKLISLIVDKNNQYSRSNIFGDCDEDIFIQSDHFDFEDEKDQDIISWKWDKGNIILDDWNRKMNYAGLAAILLIIGSGYAIINSIF